MAAGKALNTGNALYNNIVRALSPDLSLPKLIALDGGSDTASQPVNAGVNFPVAGATWGAAQGIARDSTNWYAIDNASIRKYDLSNNLLITKSDPFVGLPAGVDHCGDGFVDGDYLYLAISNYLAGSATQKVIAKYLLTTLALDSYFDLVAQTNLNASGCCLNKAGDEILVTSFFGTVGADQRNTDIYRYNKSTGAFIGIATLSAPSVGIQSITYHEKTDLYYLGSFDSVNSKNTIYSYSDAFTYVSTIDPIGTGGEMEGVESFDDELYFHTLNDPPLRLDLAFTTIVKNTTESDPIQFLDSVLMTDNVTILMKVRPLSLFSFNSVIDNNNYSNDWESWIYGDGDLAWRVNSSNRTAVLGINANQTYLFAYTWSNATGTVTNKSGVDGVYIDSATGTWVTPPAGGMWLGGINGSNDQGDHAYGDILVFDKVLSDAELLSAYNNFDDFYILDGVISVSVTETLNPFSDSSTLNIDANVSIAVTEAFQSFTDSSTVNVNAAVSIVIAVTETLNPFADSSIVNVTPAVSIEATVTEVLNSFSDSSVIAIVETGNIALNVTEILSPFNDSSALNISANVNVNITEVLNSFLDGSNVTIAKDITIQVTEVLASFTDNSFIRMPTAWVDKTPVSTTYTIKPLVNTSWTDKG